MKQTTYSIFEHIWSHLLFKGNFKTVLFFTQTDIKQQDVKQTFKVELPGTTYFPHSNKKLQVELL